MLETLDRMDGYAGLRNGLRAIGDKRGEWAGIPMPLNGEQLVIEPKYPHAEKLMAMGRKPVEVDPEFEGYRERNTFWSWHWRCDIVIGEKDGKIAWGKIPRVHGLGFALSTLGASDAWGIEQESRAIQLLGRLIAHRQFKQYMLTGTFIERSERSGVHYIFRRLRPTVAFTMNGRPGQEDEPRILAALCMHPIGYYAGSWAGAMCPTDDIVAHLMLMRGDERMFWARSNQHAPHRPEAGI